MNLSLVKFLNINEVMFLKKKVIAIIPAKHNSNELPRKNYLKLTADERSLITMHPQMWEKEFLAGNTSK